MKAPNSVFRILIASILLWQASPAFTATQITVNTVNNVNTADNEMSLLEAVLYLNQLQGVGTLVPTVILGRNPTTGEAAQVATIPGTTNRINFNITGAGPHIITIDSAVDVDGQGTLWAFPILATNVVVDGYSQLGSSPNTNPILAANNAILKIVIDGGANTFRLFSLVAENVFLRGLSVIGGGRAAVFDGEAAGILGLSVKGGSIQGCWIGVGPDGTTIKGQGYAIGAWLTGGFHVIGTDGDGVNDRNEFNVIVASDEMHVALGGADNCRVSGNFINVMPNGLTSSGATVAEGDGVYLEDPGPNNTIIGTDANGISDENERNIIGGLNGGGNCEMIAGWSSGTNILIMGNYFGVGIDGVTPLPNVRGICNDNGGDANWWQVGSNGDGVRDHMEANIIANTRGDRVFKFPSPSMTIIFRNNSFFGNTADFFNGADGNKNSYNGVILGFATEAAAISPVVSNSTTRAELIGWVPVSGDPNFPVRTNAEIHIYQADPDAAVDRPQGKKWLATYVDNGPQDLDSRTNYFRFNICALPISSTGAKITVNETVFDELGGGSSRFASSVDLPDVPNALSISKPGSSVTLSWQMNGVLQARPSLSSGGWTNVPGCSPVTLPASASSLFFRVAQE